MDVKILKNLFKMVYCRDLDHYRYTARSRYCRLLERCPQVAVQVFKDFQFQINDGFEAEARKTVNMVQEWQTPDKYDLAALGIEPWIAKARKQAVKVLNLVAVRVDNESAKVKGELADARKATDAAIRQAYDVLNALAALQPTAELTQLIQTLFGIEERAKLYYISSGKTSGDDPKPEPEPEPKPDEGGDDDGGGEVTPVTPE